MNQLAHVPDEAILLKPGAIQGYEEIRSITKTVIKVMCN